MPPKKRPRSKRATPKKTPPKKVLSRQFKVLLAALCLVGFLLVSLVLITLLRQSLQPPPAPATPSIPTTAAPSVARGLEDLRVELESALLRSGIALAQIQQGKENGIVTYDVASAFPPPEVVAGLSERIRRGVPTARIETEIRPCALLVYMGDQVVYLLRFHPPVEAEPIPTPLIVPPEPDGKPGRLAIIMDDLGQDMHTARRLLNIDLPVTFAIIPGNEKATPVAKLAHEHGREVLIHIPMEPKGYPAMNPGADALLVRQSAEEIRRRFETYRRRVPYAVGGNNHMGSAFTQNREKMAVVIEELRQAGMFFVDSRTSSQSVAAEVARDAGVATASRDVFLDNVQTVDAIGREIHKLVRIALKTGEAVGICHPYPETLTALQREVAYIRSQGVQVVFASQLTLPRGTVRQSLQPPVETPDTDLRIESLLENPN